VKTGVHLALELSEPGFVTRSHVTAVGEAALRFTSEARQRF
jgi:hypothetical protein